MGDREGRKFEKEQEPMHEQEQEQEKEGSAYKHSFVLVVPNHYSKQPCFGLLSAEKQWEQVVHYVFYWTGLDGHMYFLV